MYIYAIKLFNFLMVCPLSHRDIVYLVLVEILEIITQRSPHCILYFGPLFFRNINLRIRAAYMGSFRLFRKKITELIDSFLCYGYNRREDGDYYAKAI